MTLPKRWRVSAWDRWQSCASNSPAAGESNCAKSARPRRRFASVSRTTEMVVRTDAVNSPAIGNVFSPATKLTVTPYQAESRRQVSRACVTTALTEHKPSVLREDFAQRQRSLVLQGLQFAINLHVPGVRFGGFGPVQFHELIGDLGDGNPFAVVEPPAPEGLERRAVGRAFGDF